MAREMGRSMRNAPNNKRMIVVDSRVKGINTKVKW
jgi:hypothetical protein